MFPKFVCRRIAFPWILGLTVLVHPLMGDAWRLTVQKGEQENVWLVDERLGVRMPTGNGPDLEVILRHDLNQTIWLNHKVGSYALQPWQPGRLPDGGTPIVDPRAAKALERTQKSRQKMNRSERAAAERNLTKRYGRTTDGGPNALAFDYKPTGQAKRIGPFATKEVAEILNRQPSGRSFWVGQYPGWKKLATALQQSLDQFDAIRPDQRIPFKELGGVAIEMHERDGTVSQITAIKPLKLTPAQMQPEPQYQQIPLMLFLQQSKSATPQK